MAVMAAMDLSVIFRIVMIDCDLYYSGIPSRTSVSFVFLWSYPLVHHRHSTDGASGSDYNYDMSSSILLRRRYPGIHHRHYRHSAGGANGADYYDNYSRTTNNYTSLIIRLK